MAARFDVYLEVAAKRVFAGALAWPGWSRSGRDEGSALEALAAYAPRYRRALGRTAAAGTFRPPADARSFRVAERVQGNATTVHVDLDQEFSRSGVEVLTMSEALSKHEPLLRDLLTRRLADPAKEKYAAFNAAFSKNDLVHSASSKKCPFMLGGAHWF